MKARTFFLLLAFFLCSTSHSLFSTPDYSWLVLNVIGSVQTQTKDAPSALPLKEGNALHEGDTLKVGAGGSVLLKITGLPGEDSYTQLFENTELKMEKLSGKENGEISEVALNLILGEVFVNVEKLPQTCDFQVKTPETVAGVRGTAFSAKSLPDQDSEITLLEGNLQITHGTDESRETLLLTAGNQLLLKKGDKPQFRKIPEKILKHHQQKRSETLAEVRTRVKSMNQHLPHALKSDARQKLEQHKEKIEKQIKKRPPNAKPKHY